MSTARQSIKTTQKLIDKFVAEVRNVEEVKHVLLTDEGEFWKLWTVLDAKPFDWEIRKRIYDAEGDLLRAINRPILDFRLINLSEIDQDQHPYLLPRDAKVLYKRQ